MLKSILLTFATVIFLVLSSELVAQTAAEKDIERIYKEKLRFDIDEIIEAVKNNKPLNLKGKIKDQGDKLLSGDGKVSKSNYSESEVHAAINPNDPNNIVISPIRMNPSNPSNALVCPVYYTTDGGDTWQESVFETSPHKKNIIMMGGGDPVLAFDANGRVYLSWIMLGISFTSQQMNEADSVYTAIYWAYSDNGGETWKRSSNDRIFYIAQKATFYTNQLGSPVLDLGGMGDKQWMAIDLTNSIYKNSLYTSFVDISINLSAGTQNYDMYVSRKRGNNNSFEDSRALVSKGNYDLVQFGSIDVDAKGHVHVMFYGIKGSSQALYHSVSKDGGVTFSNEKKISNFIFNGGNFSTQNPNETITGVTAQRFYPSPYMAVDKRQGKNNVYATWTGDGINAALNQGKDIYFARSSDNGASWSTPIVVNDNTDANNSNFYSNITVSPEGKVVITWYDRRADSGDRHTEHYMAVSYDEGKTFDINKKITTQSSDFSRVGLMNEGFGIGEYCAVVADSKYAYPVWADGRTNNGNLNIYFAKVDISTNSSGNVDNVNIVNSDFTITKIFPNPAENAINVSFELKSKSKVNIFISDLNGKKLREIVSQDFNKGEYSLNYDISSFTSGSYFIYAEYNEGYAVKKFNVLK